MFQCELYSQGSHTFSLPFDPVCVSPCFDGMTRSVAQQPCSQYKMWLWPCLCWEIVNKHAELLARNVLPFPFALVPPQYLKKGFLGFGYEPAGPCGRAIILWPKSFSQVDSHKMKLRSLQEQQLKREMEMWMLSSAALRPRVCSSLVSLRWRIWTWLALLFRNAVISSFLQLYIKTPGDILRNTYMWLCQVRALGLGDKFLQVLI